MKSTLYGFEDYKIWSLYVNFINVTYPIAWLWYEYSSNKYITVNGTSIICKDNNYNRKLDENIVKDHKNLIDTAKTVYVHKCCNIPRTLVSSRFKKTLDPWTADIVVIPKSKDLCSNYYKAVLFIDENTKSIIMYNVGYWPEVSPLNDTEKALWNMSENMKLRDVLPENTDLDIHSRGTTPSQEECESLKDSVLLYKGLLYNIVPKEEYLMDICTNSLPKDKIVFEDTLQSALGTEENKITFESLISIYEMLNSKDADAINAGLKSLAMMDYVHYSNSVIYMLNQLDSHNYRWCKASNSTAVKFMLRHLCGEIRTYRRSTYLGESDTVYEEDYELYKQLVEHFDKRDNVSILDKMIYVNFITINSEGMLVPRLKETA